MSVEQARQAMKLARGLVLEIPEDDLRPAGFQVLLAHFLQCAAAPAGSEGEHENVVMDSEEKRSPDIPRAYAVKDGSRDQQAVWAVMTLAARGEQATTTAIAKLIKDELGHTPEDTTNLSNRLKGMTPKYVTRTKAGRGYIYTGTDQANKVFEATEDA